MTTPRRHPPLEALLAISALWAIELGLGLALLLLTELTQAQPGDNTQLITLTLTSLLGAALTLAILSHVAARRTGLPLRRAFYLDAIPPRLTALSLALSFAGALLGAWVSQHFSTGDSTMAQLASTTQGLLVVSFIAVAIAPALEEIYYRGFLFPSLQRALLLAMQRWKLAPPHQHARLASLATAALVTLWFGAIHIPQLLGDLVVLPVIFLMSALWTTLRCTTNSLWPSLLGHLTYNSTLILISWLLHANA